MANEEEVKTVEQPKVEETKVESPEDVEIKAKEERKSNLDKAIVEANDELRRTREATKKAKEGVVEEELPKIDENDPSSKAWDKRIKDNVAPALSQLEKQKDEVRTFALRKFLADKPALAKNPEKLKELMSNYDRIKTATEMTAEGISIDLEKAYGATFHEELVSAARNGRIDRAKEDMISTDIVVDKGASSETSAKPVKRQYSAEERKIIEGWEQMGAPKIDA